MELEPPRVEEFGPLLVAGLSVSYTDETSSGIPAQWQRFVPQIGHVPGQVGRATYGVIFPRATSDHWDYACAVAVSDFLNLPAELWRVSLPKQRYAVFSHGGYISTLRDTMTKIWTKWAPEHKSQIANAPRIERYSENFDLAAMGGVEILIPIHA